MKKILPFVMPITACYPATSHASGILFTDKNISNWMFNNFIQIFQVESNDAIDYYDFAIDNNPFLSYNELNYQFVYHNWNTMDDFLIASIRDNYYVRVFNNISKNPLYGKSNDFEHDILIFGYDKHSKMYDVADHFRNGKFQTGQCSFDELNQAIDTFDPDKFNSNRAFLNNFQLIQKETDLKKLRFSMYTPEEMDYFLSLNLQRIICSLKDYLDCIPTTNWYTRGRAMDGVLASTHKWGIDCYDVVKRKIEREDFPFLIQSCHVIHNHKLLMIERIKRIHDFYKFNQEDVFIEYYKDLLERTDRLLRLVIKYMMVSDKKVLRNRIDSLINEIRDIDYEYTLKLFMALQKI